jgi:protein O-GlcNAc transferase
VGERFRARSDGWRVTSGLDDGRVAELIRADGIDVLVDLGGHTGGHRLSVFAWRPAPVQVSYLGYPSTTGLDAIGYRLTDAVNDPPGELSAYTEALVRLPGAWCCWAPPASGVPAVAPPPRAARGTFTFGSLQNLLKLNAGVYDLWAAVLRAAPGSRLRLVRNTLNVMAREHIHAEFAARAIGPERVELVNAPTDGVGHLSAYAGIDLSLDTQPWSGHATTCESLWMGVPMLTLRGPRPSGRMSASILGAAGLEDFIAETPEHFVALAARHAADPRRLATLRATLREQTRRSPLCDGPAFTRRFESALRDLWRRWCASTDA